MYLQELHSGKCRTQQLLSQEKKISWDFAVSILTIKKICLFWIWQLYGIKSRNRWSSPLIRLKHRLSLPLSLPPPSLSSPVCVVGVILALSQTVRCLCTTGRVSSTNTLTTERESGRESERETERAPSPAQPHWTRTSDTCTDGHIDPLMFCFYTLWFCVY